MADYIFNNWKKVLDDFQNSVSKDLEEIHKQKAEVQQMKNEIFDKLDRGRYITDEERIVISAPEIVIGNVDKSGMLKSGGKVILRGSNIEVEGSGETGSITQRASIIRQTAVDPGIDGLEDVVYPHSAIISQARSLTLESNDATDAFSTVAPTLNESGIRIHADKTLQVEASNSADNHKKDIEASLESLTAQKAKLSQTATAQKKEIEQFVNNLQKFMDKEELLNANNDLIRVNMIDMEETAQSVQDLAPALYRITQDFIHTVSRLAEVTRQETALKAEKGKIKAGNEFRKASSGASLSLKGESINIANKDGDGWLRENVGAGITIETPHMGINMMKSDGTIVKDSTFGLFTNHVNISTANAKQDGSELTANGDVTISSKDIRLESMDYKKQDKLFTEKGLAANGKVSIAAKTIEVSAAKPADVKRDNTGKITNGKYTAEGDIILRSKNVSVETVDYEVSDGKPKTKGVAAGSSMLLLSETMTLGKEDDKIKSKKIDATTEEMTVTADKKLTAQLKSIEMSSDKINLSSSGNEVKGKTEFKDAVQGTELTMNKVEAKSSFKSMNIQDGM